MFNRILCSLSHSQLSLIFQEYENLTGKSMESAIKSEFAGDIQDGLLAIVQCARSKIDYFAARLHGSMKVGMGWAGWVVVASRDMGKHDFCPRRNLNSVGDYSSSGVGVVCRVSVCL